MIRGLPIVFVIALARIAWADPADPAPQSPAAQATFDAGKQAYNAGDFARAAAQFEAGFAVEPWSGFLFMWGQAVRRGGDCPKAVELYRRFIATDPPANARAIAVQNLTACGANVEPPPEPPPVPPERHAVVAPPPRVEHEAPPLADTLAIALFGIGAINLTIGAIEYKLARDDERALETPSVYPQALYDRARDRLLVAEVTGGLGGALVVAGVLRLVWHRSTSARFAVAISPRGVAIAGAF